MNPLAERLADLLWRNREVPLPELQPLLLDWLADETEFLRAQNKTLMRMLNESQADLRKVLAGSPAVRTHAQEQGQISQPKTA